MAQRSPLNIEDVAGGQNIKEREYWLKKMSGFTGKAIFPYDLKKAGSESVMETVSFDITGDISSKLMVIINGSDPRLHMFLVMALTVLLAKYSNNKDIIIGTPIYNPDMEGKFINTLLAIRSQITPGMTFKELLLNIKETIVEAVEHQNYRIKTLVYQLNLDYSETDFPLFDMVLLLENIQDNKYIHPIMPNLGFYFRRTASNIEAKVEYNSQLYWKPTIERLIRHFKNLLQEIVFNINSSVDSSEILSGEEKKQILYDFNDTAANYPADKTLHELFEEQVEKTPDNIAVSYNIDLDDIFEDLKNKEINRRLNEKYESCCFKKNSYISTYGVNTFLELLHIVNTEEIEESLLLRTHKQNYVIVNYSLFLLLNYFDGARNLKSLFNGLANAGEPPRFWIYNLGRKEEAEPFTSEKSEFIINDNFENFTLLIKMLYMSSLIDLLDYSTSDIQVEIKLVKEKLELLKKFSDDAGKPLDVSLTAVDSLSDQRGLKSPVLVLGDTPGAGSTGILYLTSFLRRNGVEAYCQWNDLTLTSAQLKENIIRLLVKVQPKLVGISMKWFLHIARILEICKVIKEYNPAIEIVIGGNTASYYSENIIQYEWIDYVVLGDGEVPLLKICMGEDDIPNCIYKKGGEIIQSPIRYVQNESNSSEIFLSHMEEIFVSEIDPFLPDYFYINTHKGCTAMCVYCAGCRTGQERVFHRYKPFLRGVKEVRNDIRIATKYSSTFMFDFDLPLYDSLDYYKKIWEGIDLSNHFCFFYLWKLPNIELIDLVSRTFKYVIFNIDLASLSQEHRKKLESLGLVKTQSTDDEVLSFFDQCIVYNNAYIQITTIGGLPYFSSEDIERSNVFLDKLIKKPRFEEIVWRRLHTQPGAPITENSEIYNMHSYATTFEEFLQNSTLNLKEERYPNLDNAHHPYVYSKDETLNSKVSELYMRTRKIINEKKEKKAKLSVTFNAKYSWLNQKANQLAYLLRERGVKPNTIIGLLMDRTVDMIIGILGVLKAGGAYLPLDPESPGNRIAYMLDDSGVSFLVASSKIRQFPAFKGDFVLLQKGLVDNWPVDNPPNTNNPRDLAYVIFTSGSTGKPKGVLIEHQNVVSYTCSSRELIHLSSTDIRLQQSSFSFDQFVEEVYPILSVGGKLIILKKSEVQDPEKLSALIQENNITVFSTTPAVLREVNKFPLAESLRRILVGGDVLTDKDISNIVKTMPVDNFYGPTETTAAATHYHYTGESESGIIPIGKPKSNYRVYILDSDEKIVPIGVSGDIYISGDSVGRGYLNCPELTEKAFIPNPFLPGKRMYNSGDRGRWLQDGNIEFVGRLDNQVKIRGFRIELEEIEKQLVKYPGVKEAVVIETKDKQLCAYITQDTSRFPGGVVLEKLIRHLSDQLPEYMIPLYFMPLEKIPLTLNGKLDKAALPDPAFGIEVQYEAPRNDIERKLVEIWAEILEKEKDTIGIATNFFQLGGHSLKATILAAQIHKEFNTKISLTDMFKTPTIKGIASLINIIKWTDNQDINTKSQKEEIIL